MQCITKRWIIWAAVAVLLLLLLLVTQFTNFGQADVQWNEAIAYSIILLALGGAYELWQWLKTRSTLYRVAFGIGFVGLFLLGFVCGAVGIIGSENNPVNLLYWTVPAVIFIGLLVSRFKSHKMARTLFAAAFVQLLIPVVALILSPDVSWGNAGVIGVFILNSIFALPFIISAQLFRRENAKELYAAKGEKATSLL